MAFTLNSKAFEAGGTIPAKFTCDGADASPQLSWSEPPQGARSLALIADDPDAPAGIWAHWVLFNLPANTRELAEGVRAVDELPGGARQGKNGFGKIGYGGPCPPPGNRIATSSSCTPSTPRSTSRQAPAKRRWNEPWKGTFWPRPS